MKVIWTTFAEQNMEAITDYIAEDNLNSAIDIELSLLAAAESLAKFPRRCRAGRLPGTRELVVHEHYIIIYEINQDAVLITAILHTSRMWPPLADRPKAN